MRRTLVLGFILILGGLACVSSAQGPQPPSAAAKDAARIEKVKDSLYVVTGSGAFDELSRQ